MALAGLGSEVVLSDQRSPESSAGPRGRAAQRRALSCAKTRWRREWPQPDLVIKSPGVPAEAAPVQRRASAGCRCGASWSWRTRCCRTPSTPSPAPTARPRPPRSWATCSPRAGRPARVLGNIGVAVTSVAGEIDPDEELVVEVSSFQLEDTVRLPAGGGRVPQPHARPSGPARHHGALSGVQGQPVRQPARGGCGRAQSGRPGGGGAGGGVGGAGRRPARGVLLAWPDPQAGGPGGELACRTPGWSRGRLVTSRASRCCRWTTSGCRACTTWRTAWPRARRRWPGASSREAVAEGLRTFTRGASPAREGRNGRRRDVCQR